MNDKWDELEKLADQMDPHTERINPAGRKRGTGEPLAWYRIKERWRLELRAYRQHRKSRPKS